MLYSKKVKKLTISKPTSISYSTVRKNYSKLKPEFKFIKTSFWVLASVMLTGAIFSQLHVLAATQNYFNRVSDKVQIASVPLEAVDPTVDPDPVTLPPVPMATETAPVVPVPPVPKVEVPQPQPAVPKIDPLPTPKVAEKEPKAVLKAATTKVITPVPAPPTAPVPAKPAAPQPKPVDSKICQVGTITSESASWQGGENQGKPTANGEIFDKNLLTAAHPTLPFGTVLEVKRPGTKLVVQVRINDRSASKLDLSEAAMIKLEGVSDGIIKVDMATVSCVN